MAEFNIIADQYESSDGRISFSRTTFGVTADSEEEARELFAEEMPEYTIVSVKKSKTNADA